jgi:hypothetical protein
VQLEDCFSEDIKLSRFFEFSISIIMSGFDISKESCEGYTKVYDGVYMTSQANFKPGLRPEMPTFNNRAFIFEAKTKKHGKHLLMSGIPGASEIPKVKHIEKDTGLKLKVNITNGDSHHLSMVSWLDAFPDAEFIHSAVRFPKSRNGEAILANPDYAKRITLVEGPDFPMLEEYSDIVKFYGFNQYRVGGDLEWLAKDQDNPSPVSWFEYVKSIGSAKADHKQLCIWLYHVPSKTLLFEHNFSIFLTKEQINTSSSFLMRMMMKAEHFGPAPPPLPLAPSDPEECRIHCETFAKILELDVTHALDYHSPNGCMCREWESKTSFHEEMTKILSAVGEHDPTGQAMVEHNAPKSMLSKCAIL